MPKKVKKRATAPAKVKEEPKSYASIYGAILAKRVAAEISPSRKKPTR
jgi:hypothetical protein